MRLGCARQRESMSPRNALAAGERIRSGKQIATKTCCRSLKPIKCLAIRAGDYAGTRTGWRLVRHAGKLLKRWFLIGALGGWFGYPNHFGSGADKVHRCARRIRLAIAIQVCVARQKLGTQRQRRR